MSRNRLKAGGASSVFRRIYDAFVIRASTVDLSLSPADTFAKLRAHKFTAKDVIYVFHLLLATFWLYLMEKPPFPFKLAIPTLFAIGLIVPLTSQIIFPAIPVFSWVLTFFSSKFLPPSHRPNISVTVLPTLESVLYGANISDILTRFTNPVLDILAWLPYGVLHYSLPIIASIFLWLFAPKKTLQFWANAFGYMNLVGVVCQLMFPCAPPWYELIYGLTPADYTMPGSAAGLARIDALFGGTGYQNTFFASPLVFGAFPSLHSAWATLEALFVSHFFPSASRYAWGYAIILYWATMYLAHHYLIDVVVGASLAVLSFHFFMPEELRNLDDMPAANGVARSKYETYDLEDRRRSIGIVVPGSPTSSLSSGRNSLSGDGEGQDIAYAGRGHQALGSAAPFLAHSPGSDLESPRVPKVNKFKGVGPVPAKIHKHTASIASLIRADDQGRGGWSPVSTKGFVFPPRGGAESPKPSRDA